MKEAPGCPGGLSRNSTLAQVLSFLVGARMLAAMNYLPQYLPFARGQSSTTSGMLLLPLMLAVQPATGRIIARTGRYRLCPVLGGALMTAGALVLLTLDIGPHPGRRRLGAHPVIGAGMGFVMHSTLPITMNSAEPRDMGAASGTVTLLRTIGGSFGVAMLGAVFTARLDGADTSLTPARLRELPEPVREGFAAAVTSGLHGVLLGTALPAALAFAAAWFVREVPPRSAPGAGQGAVSSPAAAPSPRRPAADRPGPRPS
ncbi:MFS transporter [Streptomyces sp. NPDC013457]|uniref:MFS transporter n=1 Tax=Streptomyces sp. NPDC013457 TaxID=3364866 RepID=UPI00370283BE